MSDNGDQLDRDNRQRDPDNDPPHSRVFIVCGKGTTEEELEAEFKPYGQLQYCKIIKDKNTGESKGFAYAKYDKASSAALAIESLNGKKISEDQPAFKVMIADAKGTRTNPRAQSREPEDLPPRSRLFVICSKDYTEDDLTARFKPYGEIEYCKVIKDKQSNESKGFAYVKFAKASAAALAMEEVNRLAQENGLKIKALIADPKSKNKGDGPLPVGYPTIPVMDYPPPMIYSHDMTMPGAFPMPGYMPTSRQRLFVVHHKSVTQEQLARLFSRYPGMEYCDLKKNKQTGEAKGFAYINYSTPHSAMLAKDQMDGYEYPVGSALKVMFAEPLGVKGPGSATETPAVSAMRDSFAHMGMSYPPAPMGYAHNPPPPMSPSDNQSKAMQSNDRNYPEGSRLFVILSNPLPNYLLQDLFSKYGALEYVRLQKDKNYGYAKYTTQAAAQIAMAYLNNLEFHGQKITITPALPPNSDSSL
jgi:RNA recognition motif-containing protein